MREQTSTRRQFLASSGVALAALPVAATEEAQGAPESSGDLIVDRAYARLDTSAPVSTRRLALLGCPGLRALADGRSPLPFLPRRVLRFAAWAGGSFPQRVEGRFSAGNWATRFVKFDGGGVYSLGSLAISAACARRVHDRTGWDRSRSNRVMGRPGGGPQPGKKAIR